jgi:hypothetical protein
MTVQLPPVQTGPPLVIRQLLPQSSPALVMLHGFPGDGGSCAAQAVPPPAPAQGASVAAQSVAPAWPHAAALSLPCDADRCRAREREALCRSAAPGFDAAGGAGIAAGGAGVQAADGAAGCWTAPG